MEAAMTGLDNDFAMKCPACGASGQIDICAAVWVRLCPDGTDVTQAVNGDHEWESTSLVTCNSCGHSATV